ncbi:MAG: flagellar M-ring protein FliF [Proteobacteria bacterium]|nr:flagellar M-ring protein FliF [Pseudomonadota bacterium]
MNNVMSQLLNVIRSLPLSKKISIAFTLALVIAGFAFMFMWANQADYQVLFNNLSPEDGGAIVSKLRERNIPYKIEANGTVIMVPAEKVHELRLTLAGDGLPHGGNIGFEIFDHTDFRTTTFVQELNYRRALQGELARTINQFKEVNSSKVFIVIPKESLFVEESKPASAAIQLDLRSTLRPAKLAAIIHLVASAVEGLEPGQVTVVDTKGRVIFKGGDGDNPPALLSNAQLDYKGKVEGAIQKNVQSMLEGIVGIGKAIVRVNSEIDFSRATSNEEEYDPYATVVRSERSIEESAQTSEGTAETAQTLINKRRGVVPPATGAEKSNTKKDVATNYEINKITRTILKPAGTIKHLSVAAVIDGTYTVETLPDGTTKKTYIPRSEEELTKFEDLVKRAMGYSQDREDQISLNSMSFSGSVSTDALAESAGSKFDIVKLVGNHKRTIVNLLLVFLVFFLVIRPLLKGLRKMTEEGMSETAELPAGTRGYARIPESPGLGQKERALELSKSNPEKAEQLIKGWVAEKE